MQDDQVSPKELLSRELARDTVMESFDAMATEMARIEIELTDSAVGRHTFTIENWPITFSKMAGVWRLRFSNEHKVFEQLSQQNKLEATQRVRRFLCEVVAAITAQRKQVAQALLDLQQVSLHDVVKQGEG